MAARNATSNATSSRRELHLGHEFFKSGTFCLGNHLAPLVMILGCQRCGTASLYEDVMTHVLGARRGHTLHGEPDFYAREQHFFATDSWSKGVHHYLDHFPTCPNHGGSELTFSADATPAYLRKPIVATRIKEVYPPPAVGKLKFMMLLRDPSRRLYAYWDTFVQSGSGANNFGLWVEELLKKVLACQRQHGPALWPPPDEGRCDEDTVEGVAAGLYVYQLTYWFRQFSPQQFFVSSLDGYERDSAKVLQDAAAFIGAPRQLVGTPRQVGTADTQAMKVLGAMPDSAKSALGKFYHQHNAQLVRFLNGQPRATYSPSLKGLEISGWIGE